MSLWAAWCEKGDREAIVAVVASLDGEGRVLFAQSADVLRRMAAGSEPGELGVVVGPVGRGVSDVNLAAALARDGRARQVVLAGRAVSGSLRSRAARAGIDLVVDLAEVEEVDDAEVPCSPGERDAVSPPPRPCPPEMAPAAPPVPDPDAGSPRVVRDGAPVLVLCSGRGGVGKTTLAASLVAVGARWGLEVALLDLDLSCGNAHAAFGLPAGTDLARLGDEGNPAEGLLARLFVTAAPGVALAGPCARPEAAELAAARMGALIDHARRSFDLVVADTSTTFTDAVAQAAQAADRLLIVSDARRGSVAPVARMSGLAVRLGVARTRIARLENHADERAAAGPVAGRSEIGLEAARIHRVCDGGREVEDLVAAGRVADLVEPGYAFSDSVAALLAQLLSELGRLPEHEEARRAAEGPPARAWRWPFGTRREAR
ncbi:nucleotide-binding protein [Thermophilibacter sp.]